MKFKTETGQAAYQEIIEDVSKRSAELYAQSASSAQDSQIKLLMDVAVASFHVDFGKETHGFSRGRNCTFLSVRC